MSPSPPSSPTSNLTSPRPFPSLLPHATSLCPPITALPTPTPHLSTLDPLIDDLLNGGLPTTSATITELTGPSASGKTQLALQLALSAARDTAAIYIPTDSPFPSSRLTQLCTHLLPAQTPALSRIVIEPVASHTALLALATDRLPYLLRATGATLIVVDSIAAPFRHEISEALDRSAALATTAAALTAAARDAGAAIVCVNHVAARMGGGDVPALGHGWDICVGVRLWLEKTSAGRVIKLIRAPHAPPGEVEFVLDEKGIRGVEE